MIIMDAKTNEKQSNEDARCKTRLAFPDWRFLHNRLRLRNDLYCVEWGVKLYSLTHCIIDATNTREANRQVWLRRDTWKESWMISWLLWTNAVNNSPSANQGCVRVQNVKDESQCHDFLSSSRPRGGGHHHHHIRLFLNVKRSHTIQ